MTTKDRATLKQYFRAGARPTEEQFAVLIDSALIMDDEGFRKTLDDGLRIASEGDSTALLSFERAAMGRADWSVGFPDNKGDRLVFKRGPFQPHASEPRVMTLGVNQARPRVRIGGADEPQDSELDVVGLISADGRVGRASKTVPADGHYHDITPVLRGCVALEVMAGVGLPGTGRFALVRAVAMNTYNPAWWNNLLGRKKPIRCQHAFYARGSDRLQLRWEPRIVFDQAGPLGQEPSALNRLASGRIGLGSEVNYRFGRDSHFVLQIRSRSSYADEGGAAPPIRAYVTRLWYDAAAPTNAAPDTDQE